MEVQQKRQFAIGLTLVNCISIEYIAQIPLKVIYEGCYNPTMHYTLTLLSLLLPAALFTALLHSPSAFQLQKSFLLQSIITTVDSR